MSGLKLYCFGESGNAYKAALMLELCHLQWEAVPVDFFNGETRSAAYRENVNEMGEVPVLLHGGRKFVQSGVILTYLSETTGKFGGHTEAEKLDIFSWILFDNHKFTANIATLRFLVALAKTGEPPVTEFLRARVAGAAAIVEKHLATRSFMVADRPTIADLSLCGYLFHPEEYGVDWSKYPHIGAWLERIKQLPGWKEPYEMMARAPAKRV